LTQIINTEEITRLRQPQEVLQTYFGAMRQPHFMLEKLKAPVAEQSARKDQRTSQPKIEILDHNSMSNVLFSAAT
jgi:hypothetical protein